VTVMLPIVLSYVVVNVIVLPPAAALAAGKVLPATVAVGALELPTIRLIELNVTDPVATNVPVVPVIRLNLVAELLNVRTVCVFAGVPTIAVPSAKVKDLPPNSAALLEFALMVVS